MFLNKLEEFKAYLPNGLMILLRKHNIYLYIDLYRYIYTHIHTHTYIHTHTHTHTHTYTSPYIHT